MAGIKPAYGALKSSPSILRRVRLNCSLALAVSSGWSASSFTVFCTAPATNPDQNSEAALGFAITETDFAGPDGGTDAAADETCGTTRGDTAWETAAAERDKACLRDTGMRHAVARFKVRWKADIGGASITSR
eukprot:CAMPEP_0119305130 /NCGR_PEP_ID=MMETSP1333-20130426/6201_1 /TAXON_ID=418940 /ORGANISM="Scyphosphaera apsteinii, Strain RCC1455" /LENGTH=132 /DNA_ID=CAMNT_0007308151 /DNA_START=762 /DNA_END=1156 /DNA_ORIENTATION=+